MDQSTTKRQLAEQIRTGDEKAWESFIRANFRSAANFLVKVLHDSELAGRLTSQTFARALENVGELASSSHSTTAWLLLQAKDVCFDNLISEDYQKTVFSHGQEIYGSPPALRAIPTQVLDSDTNLDPNLLKTIYDEIRPEHELFLELFFVEGCSLPSISEIFGISENLATSFLFSIMSALGNFASFEHSAECKPDLFLCKDALENMGRTDVLKEMMEKADSCTSCRRLIFRTIRMHVLFAEDTRPNVAPDAALLKELAPRKRKSTGGKVSTFVPIPVRDVPQRSHSIMRSLIPATIVALFIYAMFTLFQDNLVTALAPISPAAAHIDKPVNTRPRRGAKAPSTIGTFHSATVAQAPLFPGQQVHSSLRGEVTINYAVGHVMTLERSTSVKANRDGAALTRGTITLEFDPTVKKTFSITTREVRVATLGKKVIMRTMPGRGTLVGVLTGQAKLTLPNGTTFDLEQDQHVLIKPGGKYLKKGGVSLELFKPKLRSSANGAFPLANGESGSNAVRRVDLKSIRSKVRSGIHRSPDINPPRFVGKKTGSGRPRGYKDYF